MSRNTRNVRRAFSLLELMLVVAIMGVLMAVVGLNLVGAGDRAKKRATEATLKTIASGIDQYHMDHSTYPPDLQTLVVAKYVKDMKLADGWGSPLVYDPRPVGEGQDYQLGSPGPDKLQGNQDDITVWGIGK